LAAWILIFDLNVAIAFRSQVEQGGGLVTDRNYLEPQVNFDWGINAPSQKFMHIEQSLEGFTVTVHPGLSYQQVTEAAKELGEHGPAVISAWERHTGFTAQAN
jgi:hypothetical protein